MADAQSYFTDESMLRRVHREWAVALSAPRALLMQAAHPVAFAGFFRHTGSLDEPYQRLERTAEVMDTIVFGPRAKADRMTRRVRAMHRKVRGEADGVAYRADDPELLLWILACLVDSALLVYGRYVGPLTRDERDRYWQEYKLIGNLFALRDEEMPGSIEDFDAYMADMLGGDVLHVSDAARELAVQIVMNPPVPTLALPLLKGANFATIGLLPERLRRAYGFSWDPMRGLVVRAGAEYTRRVLVPLLPSFIRHVPRARAA